MREPLTFFVAGLPKAQPRVKAARRGKFTSIYTPPGAHEDWAMAVRFEAEKAWRDDGYPNQWTGPLCVNLTFYFPRPRIHYRSNGDLKPDAPRWHTAKPDRDNSDKKILDTLTNLCIWKDDSQVCDGRIQKCYADGGLTGCLVEIKEAAKI